MTNVADSDDARMIALVEAEKEPGLEKYLPNSEYTKRWIGKKLRMGNKAFDNWKAEMNKASWAMKNYGEGIALLWPFNGAQM